MNAGVALVEHVYREMRVDDRWALRRPRGFTWWAGSLAQYVWADPPVKDAGHTLCRVHAQTDLLTKFRISRDSIHALQMATRLNKRPPTRRSERPGTRARLLLPSNVYAT